jgi:hypothetical protein
MEVGQMRRRNPLASAALVAMGAVLVLALPGVVAGVPRTSDGGTPSDVFSTTDPAVCAEVYPTGTATFLETGVTVDSTSHLLVSFSAERSGIKGNNELLVQIDMLTGGVFVQSTPTWGFNRTFKTHESGTVEWTFDNVAAGTYFLRGSATVDPAPPGPGGSAESTPTPILENCALTVVVSPVA